MSKNLVDKDSFEFVEGVEKTIFDSHTHDASDIVSGELSVANGGTGADNANDALSNLGGISVSGATAIINSVVSDTIDGKIIFGTYTGSNETTQTITLNAKPRAVLIYHGTGLSYSTQDCLVVLMFENFPAIWDGRSMGQIENTGFSITAEFNNSGKAYGYMAIM